MAKPHTLQHEAAIAVDLQKRFFSGPNDYRLDAPHGTPEADVLALLQKTLRRHERGYTDRPVLLPFRSPTEHRTIWYACAPTEEMLRALASELSAFLGPSYIHLAAPERLPDVPDAHAIPLLETAGWRAIRFEATTEKFEKTVLQLWGGYWQLLDRRPKAASYIPQTFDQLRAAFDRALLARNETGAAAALSSLRERHGLSAENRLFLEIRLAAAFERWQQIADHRLLPTIVHLNLPPETYGDVMEALYQCHVRPFERAPRLEDLLVQFRETVAEAARPLFRTRRTSRRSSVLKAFVLGELVQEEPRAEVCAGLVAQLPLGAFGDLDAAVREHISTLATTSDVLSAQQALDQEQFDRAYDLLWAHHDDLHILRALVLCARESEDPLKAHAVLIRLAAAAPAIREAVEAASPGRLQRLRSIATAHRKSTERWEDQLAQGDEESLDNYVERWRELARSTAPSSVLDAPRVGAVAADCLMRQALEQPEAFERLYPLWHELFVERVPPDSRLLSVYLALLETIRARDRFTETELALLQQTLVALVHAGADHTQYGNAVEEVHAVFLRVRSPYVLAWALDICDTLAIAPARDSDARMRFLTAVVQACLEFQARMTRMQQALLKMLAAEAGLELAEFGVAADTISSGNEESWRGRLIAFYSLDESATRRATTLLKDLHPSLKIESSSDSVCTPRLKALAQHADIFVFAWKSSKHAAYDCVKAAVKAKDDLVMARGAGTTSLVEAVLERMHLDAAI